MIQAIPTSIKDTFDKALEMSSDHNCFFLANICQDLEVAKSFFSNNISEYEELSKTLELINTNLESNVLRAVQGRYIDTKFAQFALESIHGWKADGDVNEPQKIIVEGIATDELIDLLIGDEDN